MNGMILARVGVSVLALAVLVGIGVPAEADDGKGRQGTVKARLDGYEETPAVSTTGEGEWRAKIHRDDVAIDYELRYEGLEGTASAAHIHLGRRGTSGGVIAFLCGGGGKPDCPPEGAVSGTITAADVVGPAAQGIEAGEFDELIQAIRSGAAYVNVHSDLFPAGEIRGEVR